MTKFSYSKIKIPADPNTILRLQFIVFLWGFTGIFGKLITIEAIPLIWFRMLITAAAVYLFIRIRKLKLRLNRKELLILLGVGGIVALHWITFFHAIKISNVSVVLSTLSLGALFSSLLEPLFFKSKIKFYEVILGIIVTMCIVLIFFDNLNYWLGIVFGIITSFLSALFTVINAKISVKYTSTQIILYEMTGGFLLVCLMLTFTRDWDSVFNIGTSDFLWVLLLGILFTAYPQVEAVNLFKYISPFTLLLNVNLEPVYGIIIAYILFQESEKMNWIFYAATAIMILCIVINVFLKKKYSKKLGTDA